MRFADVLKKLRNNAGLTQDDLANSLEISRSTVAGYEANGKEPTLQTLIKIADTFDVTTDYLIGRIAIKTNFSEFEKTLNSDKELPSIIQQLIDRNDLKELIKDSVHLSSKEINKIIQIIKVLKDDPE